MATEYIRSKECARLLGIAPRTLILWHEEGRAPPCYISEGKRLVRRYRRADVLSWMNDPARVG